MRHKAKSIRWVLINTYIISMGVAIMAGLIVINRITKKAYTQRNHLNEVQIAQNFQGLFSLSIDSIQNVGMNLAVDKKINDLLETGNEDDRSEVLKTLKEATLQNAMVTSIHLIDMKGNAVLQYGQTENNSSQAALFRRLHYRSVDRMDDKAYIGVTIESNQNLSSENTLYIVQSVKSLTSGTNIGAIVMILRKDALREKLLGFMERMNFEVSFIDDSNRTYHFKQGGELEQEIEAKIKNEEDNQKKKSKLDTHEIYAQLVNCRFDGQIVIKLKNVQNNVDLKAIILGLIIINLIFLLAALAIINRRMIEPLEQIAEDVNTINDKHNLMIRFYQDNHCRETQSIERALNGLLDRINVLMKQAQERERLHSRLQLAVINHQVNPHFLYNTLNSVGLLVSIEDKATALEIIKSLARYYRACLNKNEEVNTIEEELTLTKEYINIMMLKDSNLLRVSYDIDKKTLKQLIPRMTLQILIENAIKYGVKTVDEPLHVHIAIQLEEEKNRMQVIVEDDGAGISKEKIDEIYEGKLYTDSSNIKKSGFGLQSIITRIKLIYNITEVYDILSIDSVINKYTKIKVFIPTRTIDEQGEIQEPISNR